MNEGEFVYVVTRGEYSDYGIQAVCSTEEKARAAIEKLREESSSSEPYDIEPYRLDEALAFEIGPVFSAAIRLDDGSAVLVYGGHGPIFRPDQSGGRHLRHPNRAEIERYGPDDEMVRRHKWPVQVRATSPFSYDHALKVAVEARQAWLRELAVKPTP